MATWYAAVATRSRAAIELYTMTMWGLYAANDTPTPRTAPRAQKNMKMAWTMDVMLAGAFLYASSVPATIARISATPRKK